MSDYSDPGELTAAEEYMDMLEADRLAKAIVIGEEWRSFSTGRWVKEMPEVEGVYPTAEKDGYPSHPITVVWNDGWYNSFDTADGILHFEGWWWDRPYPELPSPPSWD